MPAGGTTLGFVYYVATKFAGYTAYSAWAIGPRAITPPDEQPIGALQAGLFRTLLGAAIGAVVGIGFWKIPYFSNHDTVSGCLFYGMLIPVRIFEWWLLLRVIYKNRVPKSTSRWLIGWGIGVSFALDVAGIAAAFVIPGGAWVC